MLIRLIGIEKVYEMIDTCVGNLLAEIAGR